MAGDIDGNFKARSFLWASFGVADILALVHILPWFTLMRR